jgi:hypothetical protein
LSKKPLSKNKNPYEEGVRSQHLTEVAEEFLEKRI